MLNADGTETQWPEAEFVVGNPPFLGDKKMIAGLGEEYTECLRRLYKGRVPGGADLVAYWFEKARAAIEQGKTKLAGLVSTNSLRGGANRKVLDRIKNSGDIYEAWDDEPWVVEGAAVRVSLICFTGKEEVALLPHKLDGQAVETIYADLTAGHSSASDLTQVRPLAENRDTTFIGTQKNGAFDIPGSLARQWLQAPLNPNRRPNSDVLRPWANGLDITRRPSDTWIVDFGVQMGEESAALYELPFQYAVEHIKQAREGKREVRATNRWWLLQRSRPDMRRALQPLERYMLTPRTAKYRLFAWRSTAVLPDCQIVAIARDDDTTFGILHSRFHELWALRLCTWLGVGNDPRYTPSTTFDTFPFPEGLTPDMPAAAYADDPRAQQIADAARRLDELRNNWLSPSDLIVRVPEVVEGYPDRILPKDEAAARILKTRTLTNLYNERPAWLDNAHRALDEAVAHAYGWQPAMSEEAMLAKLLALNVERAQERPE